jgi:hypothetical protein
MIKRIILIIIIIITITITITMTITITIRSTSSCAFKIGPQMIFTGTDSRNHFWNDLRRTFESPGVH